MLLLNKNMNIANPTNCTIGYMLTIGQQNTIESIDIMDLQIQGEIQYMHKQLLATYDNMVVSVKATASSALPESANFPRTAEFTAQLTTYLRAYIYETEGILYNLPVYFEPFTIRYYEDNNDDGCPEDE
jgi:hypothetical protein